MKIRERYRDSMISTADMARLYVDLVTSSLDTDIIEQPDIKYIVQRIGREDFAAAERRCLLRVQNHGDDCLSWALYALLLILQAEEREAGEALERAISLEPENVLVLNLLGDYLCCSGREKEGEDAYMLSLSKQETQVHARKMLYFQFMSHNEYQRALDVIVPALQTRPDDENTWTSIKTALAMFATHEYAEKLAESLAKDFSDQHLAWQFKAHVYLATRKLTEAELAARRAIELKQEDALNWNFLGTILNMQGKHNAAIKCQRRAVSLSPKDGMLWTSLALALLKAGKHRECQQVISKAVKIDPEAAMEVLQHLMNGNR
jgi:Tfp pilus assembly protein PilF